MPYIGTKAKRSKRNVRKGSESEVKDFTGISAPYEEPDNPELILETDKESVEQSVNKVLAYLENHGILI